MSEVKVNASFILQGSVLPAEPPLLKNGKKKKIKKNERKIEYESLLIPLSKGKPLVINVRKAIPAVQNLHLSLESYQYMTNEENPVKGITKHQWKSLSKTKRVEAHLKLIAEDLNGVLDSFSIMDN